MDKTFNPDATAADQQRAIVKQLEEALFHVRQNVCRAVVMVTVGYDGKWKAFASGVSVSEAAGFFMAGATAMTNKMHGS